MTGWLLAVILMTPIGASTDPVQALRELEAYRNAQRQAAMDAREISRLSDIDAEIARRALALTEGVDVASVALSEAMPWARIFEYAERYADAVALVQRYLVGPPAPAEPYAIQVQLMQLATRSGQGELVYELLMQAKPPSPGQATTLGSLFGGQFHHPIHESLGAERALAVARHVRSLMPEKPTGGVDAPTLGWALRQTVSAEAYYLAELGRADEAIATIDAVYGELDEGTFRREGLLAERTRYTLLNRPAPPLPFERQHGSFASLESNRGRVVLVEFTAHWCHACHKAIPGLRQLQREFGDRLEIVGVTTYYGYFGGERTQERDMPPDEEFARMPALMREKEMTWPLVYTNRSVYEAYGVSGIPQMVVIDPNGIVRRIDTGYSEGKLQRLRAAIRDALAIAPDF